PKISVNSVGCSDELKGGKAASLSGLSKLNDLSCTWIDVVLGISIRPKISVNSVGCSDELKGGKAASLSGLSKLNDLSCTWIDVVSGNQGRWQWWSGGLVRVVACVEAC
nr:hypothetical protein [Tanacetum cinerariifolium]